MSLPEGVRGELVAIDDLQLRVLDTGDGTDCVVFETGAMGTLDTFNLVRELLGPSVRVIAYDRPGLGFSTINEAALDRSPVAVSQRLARLLDVLGVTQPLVLCGHSLGGFYVRAFAAAYPERVRALVLVDPSDERMLTSAPKALQVLGRAQTHVMSGGMRAMAATGGGLARHVGPQKLLRRLELPDAELPALLRAVASPTSLRTMARELRAVEGACEQMQGLPDEHSVPLTMLSAGKGRTKEGSFLAAVNTLHAELVEKHQGIHRIVAESGHLMPWDAPAAISSAIHERFTATT